MPRNSMVPVVVLSAAVVWLLAGYAVAGDAAGQRSAGEGQLAQLYIRLLGTSA